MVTPHDDAPAASGDDAPPRGHIEDGHLYAEMSY